MGLLLDRKSLPHTAQHEAVRPGLDIDESIITMEDYSAVQAQEILIVEEPYTPEDSDLDTQVVSIDYKECASTMRQRLETFFPFIDRSQVKFGKQIGRGGQGTVYEAVVRFPSTDKAMKMAVKKFNPKLRSLQGIYPRELWLHDYFFVLKPKAFFFDDDSSLCMVMPRYSGDLRDVIDAQVKVKSGAPFEDSISLSMIVQLAIAMKGLHTSGIYHRDLKAANILVIRYFPYLRDFYYICNIADFENSENVKGTAFWRAPEVLMSLKTNVPLAEHQWRAADVYSFGMTCYEIATGEIPFHDRRFTDYDIVINGGRPELPDHVPELLRDIILSCWHPDPDCRPDFGEILEVLMSKCREDPILTGTFMEDLDARRVAVISNSEDPQSDLKELKEIVLRHYAVNHDAIVGRKNYASWGLIYVNALERFVSQYGWDTHRTHPSLPFVDYIERRKLHAVLNCASSRFGNALDMVFEGEERAQVLKEHGPAFVLEKQRMMLLTLALYAVTLQGIEYTQCEDDEHLTLDEKLRMVDNLSADLGDFHGDDGRWALIDDILYGLDPDDTSVKIALFRDHMNYVARSQAFRKKYDSTLIYMIVMCVMVYMIYIHLHFATTFCIRSLELYYRTTMRYFWGIYVLCCNS